jgi:anti-repressor protein
MNDLIHNGSGGGSPASMSTKEIAELTGKRHDNVMRDARAMLIELHGENDLLKFEGVYLGGNGEQRPCFNLPKRETLILVSGYNLVMRARIIDRWQELEAAQPDPMAMLNDPAAMRGILLSYTEKVIALEAKVESDAPKVAFAEQVAAAPDAISLAQAAKITGTGRNRLCQMLRESRWLTRTNEPYQDKIEAGLLDVKIGSWEHPEKGLQRSVTALVTGKGLARIQKMVGSTAH